MSTEDGASVPAPPKSLRERRAAGLSLSVSTKQAKPTRSIKRISNIEELFEIKDEIYEGGNKAKVSAGVRKSDGRECVVKVRPKIKDGGSGERSWRAVTEELLNLEGCIHVLDLEEVYEDDDAYYAVMEKCSGGELFEFLLNATEVSEKECKRIIVEILEGLDHLHSKGIIHRDVKPENIMFTHEPQSARLPSKTVKLIDFDTCQSWGPMTPKSTRVVGTPGYIAPESLRGEFTPRSDLWGVGIIFYVLMTGDMPFGEKFHSLDDNKVANESAKKMHSEMLQTEVDWDIPPWPDFPQARDMCQHLLCMDPEQRFQTAKDALAHPWLADCN